MFKSLPATASIPWAGPNAPNFAASYPSGVILEGDQCLVFFLGGPPGVPQGTMPTLIGGFSTNSGDPVYLPPYNAGRPQLDRKNSYEFKAARLVNRATPAYPSGHPFPSYIDAYEKTPFQYFSANSRPNGYDTVFYANPPTMATSTLGVVPYLENPGRYYMADSFQLLSAGADGVFGAGGCRAGSATGNGVDDVCNFYDTKTLGIP
jgi:hypothetical protein